MSFSQWPIIKQVIEGCKPQNINGYLQRLIKEANNPAVKGAKKASTGKIMLFLSVAGMISAAVTNTFAAAVDKNTSAEDKKFLVPAGAVTGIANIGLYYLMTDKMIKGLEKSAGKYIADLAQNNPVEFTKKATTYINSIIKKAESGLFKNSEKHIKNLADMKKNLLQDEKTIAGGITDYAKDLYANHAKSGAGVLGAFAGAVIGCSILTPIIRDVSAWAIQKRREKNNPELKEQPYKPYFEPTRIESHRYGAKKQPLSMKNYMAFANSGNLKV